jgi:hypothetical protein
MRTVAACVALALALGPFLPALQAQGTILFEMNLASPNAYGFGGGNPTDGSSGQSNNNGTFYTFTHRAAAGPGGGNAAELAMTPITVPTGSCAGQGSCEGYIGWGYPSPWSARSQGSSLFFRFRIKFTAFNDPRRADSGGWGGKFILVGDSCSPDTDRIIANLESASIGTSQPRLTIDKNINGVGTNVNLSAPGTWDNIQMQVLSSSTTSATDGIMRIWKNNDVEGSPDASSATLAWNSACFHSNMKMGTYMDWLVSTVGGAQATWQIGAFEVGTAFDATWNGGAESPPVYPVTPGGSRFRSRVASVLDAWQTWGAR